MDVNHWLAGFAALVFLGLGVRWARQAPPPAAPQPAKPGKPKSLASIPDAPPPAAGKPAKAARASNPLDSVPSFVPDDDVEITLIAAFPVKPTPPETTTLEVTEAEAGAAEPAATVELSYEAEAEEEEVTSPNARILIYSVGDSDRGRVRKRNEDSLLTLPERSVFIVADGMGGHAGGDVASATAVEVMRDSFERAVFNARTKSDVEVPRRAREVACAIQMANEAIFELSKTDTALKGMGTTIVAARFSPNKQRVYIGHVGDSRCYRLRGDKLRQLTADHTMSSLGVKGPRGNDLYQAVGVGPTISIDLIVDKPRENDAYLLCTDGLTKMVSNDEIEEVLAGEADLEAAIYRLMELANDRGGKDNITMILVKVMQRVPA